jgi:hypothetical protein
MSKSVDFTGLANAVLSCEGGTAAVLSLGTEDASVPRTHACGILESLCRWDFGRFRV